VNSLSSATKSLSVLDSNPGPYHLGLAHLVLLLAACCGGCVERYLRIETDPPAADVYVNGDRVGTSPLDVPFRDYGTVRVDAWFADVETGTFASSTALVDLDRPWYQYFPLEILSELLDPRVHVDRHDLRLSMTKVTPGTNPIENLMKEAERLRRRSR